MQQDPLKRIVSQENEEGLWEGVGRSRRAPFYSMDWESAL